MSPPTPTQITTTTTLFTNPTFLGSHSPASAPIPVAAIAGGSSAGVFLAIIAVFGWKCWGRHIQKQQRLQRQALERQKAARAAIAFKRSVISGKNHLHRSSDSVSDPRRSRPSLSKSPSDRKVQFADVQGPAPAPALPQASDQKQTHLPIPISSPRPLKPKSTEEGLIFPVRSPRKLKAGLLDGKATYKPLYPSPLAASSSVRPSDTLAGSQTAPDARSIGARIPRVKNSRTSLSAETWRQSKSSQNSASDQSRYSSADGSTRRWSWRSLINGPGFSFHQIGVGTGKNRLSADSSSLSEWPEEDPSVPIGYAYSGGLDEGYNGGVMEDTDGYIYLDTTERKQSAVS